MAASYIIKAVVVLSREEQLAYVETDAGQFVVSVVPQAFTDARDAGIIANVNSVDKATAIVEGMIAWAS